MTWWEAFDWTGMKELGALKSGRDAQVSLALILGLVR